MSRTRHTRLLAALALAALLSPTPAAGKTPEQAVDAAWKAYDKGKYDDVRRLLSAADEQTLPAEGLYLWALSYAAEKGPFIAEYYNKGREREPDTPLRYYLTEEQVALLADGLFNEVLACWHPVGRFWQLEAGLLVADALLETKPDHAKGLAFRAMFHCQSAEFTACEEDAARAIALGENDAHYHRLLALLWLGRWDETAMAEADWLVANDQDKQWAHSARALLRLEKGDRDGAIADVAAANSDLTTAWLPLAAQVAVRKAQGQDYTEHLRRMLTQSTIRSRGYIPFTQPLEFLAATPLFDDLPRPLLADIVVPVLPGNDWAMEDVEGAFAEFAWHRDPDDPFTNVLMGIAKAGDPSSFVRMAAREALERAFVLEPRLRTTIPLLYKGWAEWSVSDIGAAKADYAAAMAIDPELARDYWFWSGTNDSLRTLLEGKPDAPAQAEARPCQSLSVVEVKLERETATTEIKCPANLPWAACTEYDLARPIHSQSLSITLVNASSDIARVTLGWGHISATGAREQRKDVVLKPGWNEVFLEGSSDAYGVGSGNLLSDDVQILDCEDAG